MVDVRLCVGEPVHELTGQTQHLPLGLRELGKSVSEPGIALGHVRDEGDTPCGGEFEQLMTPVGLVPRSGDEPIALQLSEHPGERLRPLMRGGGQPSCRGRTVPIHVAEHAQLIEAQALWRTLDPKALGEAEGSLADTGGGLSESLELHPQHISTLSRIIFDSKSQFNDQMNTCSQPDGESHFYANPLGLFTIGARIPGDRLRAALPGAVVAITVVLASFGSALALEDIAHLHLDIVIEAVILAATVSRVQRSAELHDRLNALVVLPAAAIGASEISRMISSKTDLGDLLFLSAAAGAVWARRFGPTAAKTSMLLAAPLVAVLILQGEPTIARFQTAPIWVALVACICCLWATVIQLGSARIGFDRPRPRRPSPRSRMVIAGSSRFRLDAPTRMALQMAAGLAVAFVVGRSLWPEHWTWVVLTAFIVCSGARGRGDVVLKGVLRAFGAAVGTLVAAGFAGLFGPGDVGAVACIFVVLGLAMWLRQISYAYWAGCVTAAISLFYGWLGVPAGGLLCTRLEGIAVGAVIGIAASWLILPVRTSDVVRRRCGEVMTALGDLIVADWNDPEALRQRERAHSVIQLSGCGKLQGRIASFVSQCFGGLTRPQVPASSM